MNPAQERPGMERVTRRVREKNNSYVQYNFSIHQNNLLKCFFDLAQEFDSIHDLYCICVVVPMEMLDLESTLYLLDDEEKSLQLVCSSTEGVITDQRSVPTGIYLSSEPYKTAHSYVVPIFRKPLPAAIIDDDEPPLLQHPWQPKSRLLGMFEIHPLEKLKEEDLFFFTKYTNRIGYTLHNRLLVRQNIRHLEFINSLVMDIEHNVIIPNMYFKHLFNQLRRKLTTLASLESAMQELIENRAECSSEKCTNMLADIGTLRRDLVTYQGELEKHHANMSLFLESLFRREHFQRGYLVLQPKPCCVEDEIIRPQLEQYENRLKNQGISIDRPTGMAGERISLNVDIGLISQVYANLFSNAVKYTTQIIDNDGKPRKAVAYGREVVEGFFGPGQSGIKFNMFTTGHHLNEGDRGAIFQEGFRCEESKGKSGSGHGLAFVKHVVEMHGGKVGYEATAQGNNFYFILPLPAVTMALNWPPFD